MDAGFTGLARPLQPVTATVAPKAAEAVQPQARNELPENKTVTPPVESAAVRLDKKRVRDEERDKDRKRDRDADHKQGEDEDVASMADQAATAFVNACAGGYISDPQTPPGDRDTNMRAYYEKLAGEKKPLRHRVEKLA